MNGNEYWLAKLKEKGFWFVDIPRTASSSIRAELGKEYGPLYGKENLIEQVYRTKQVFQDHIPASHMKRILGTALWDKLYTFAFVRNPWERMVSFYYYRIRKGHFGNELSFRDYVLRLRDFYAGQSCELFTYHGFYLSCSDYILDAFGNNLVSFVGKYENRAEDLDKIAGKLGFRNIGKLWIQKSAEHQGHYSSPYDDETAEIIRNIFSRDILLFDYKFEKSS
ncbi:MAG: hypothetical protein BMS9Abin08_0365 [Gammaproteobacteria bacterium]|nr:MAG: hypothetical protein BMS9Abin08_0365 [Gammaproteobacteria bacterium]